MVVKKDQMLDSGRGLIESQTFKRSHCQNDKIFTRKRSLTFERVLTLILRKSIKPLQCAVNEAMQQFGHESSVSSSAYSQARQKFRHTAFIELNQKTVVEIMYGDDDYQTFWGHRLLAVDGTKIRLPNEPAIRHCCPEKNKGFGVHIRNMKKNLAISLVGG